MKTNVRSLILPLHRWTGLTVGLLVVFVAITGAAMVFQPQLQPLAEPGLHRVPACGERLSLDTIAAAARKSFPDGRMDYIRIYGSDDEATQVRFASKAGRTNVYVDPCAGTVLGQQDRYGWVFGKLEYLHRLKFIANSSLVAGTAALLLALVIVVGGLIVWWPATSRSFRASVRFNPRLTGRARTLNRHQTIGLYASIIVLISALTGITRSFDWTQNVVQQLTGSRAPAANPQSPAPGTAQRLPMEVFWRRAQALVPRPADALVFFPQNPRDPVAIDLLGANAPHSEAWSHVYLDAYTGDVLEFRPYATSSTADKVLGWALSLHKGKVGGLFGQLLLFIAALAIPYLAYSGISGYLRGKFRTVTPAGTAHLTVKVVKKALEATDICTLELADLSGAVLPSFSAGSHIDVHVRQGLSRQYSLCNDPQEKHRYLIGVLRDANSRGGSIAMHEEIEEGDLIEISQPKNHFPLAHAAKRSLLLAGGIGITPILCMAERLANIDADFEMHYCSRSPARTAFLNRIKQSAYCVRVSFHFDDGPPEQRLDFQALLANPGSDTHLYVCGPTGFMDLVIEISRQKGWREDQIHREYFAAPVQRSDSDVAFDVKIASTGKVYQISKDQTIVAALSVHGIDIPTSCEQGVCGTCATRIIDGEPDHRDVYLTGEERAKNDQFTPCCSRAKSPMLVLDL